MAMLKQMRADKLLVRTYDSRDAMGRAAGEAAAACLREILAKKEEANVIFAAAPSQNEMLACLARAEDVDWARVNAFHMDEYVGLAKDAPQAFGRYLFEHIFGLVPFKSVHYINGWAEDAKEECARYSELLRRYPADLVCLGIGENGHIAFNDPWEADFSDRALVKTVRLDPVCRQQQVNDGCFACLDDVPTQAFSLTVPALAAAAHMVCTVPAKTKAEAVQKTVREPVSEQVPATVMRRHEDAAMYCDADSGALLL